MKKHFGILLLTAALFTASCGADATQPTDTDNGSDASVQETTQTEAVDSGIHDNLGDFDFGGETFHMLTRTYDLIHANMNSTEMNGEALNDAIFVRNRALEQRFNIVFEETYYNFAQNTNDYPRQFLLAGDNEYDLYTGRMINMFTFAAEGLFLPVEDIPHINPEQPWWNASLYDVMQIAGSRRFIVGEFNLSSADFTHVLLFNKELVKEYGIGDLYALVRDGKWTFDAFSEFSKLAVRDLNGDQEMNENDQYGYTAASHQILTSFGVAAGAEMVVRDDAGLLDYIAPENEKVIEVFNRVYEMTWDNDVWHFNNIDDGTLETEIFRNGGSLFGDSTCFHMTTVMRDAPIEFGVLPYPKWDEAQETYFSRIEGCELFGVSIHYPDTEMIGVVLEAMACASYNDLRPAYYDSALRVKGTRDEESVEMLDLIFANRIFDYGDTLLVGELTTNALKFAFRANQRNLVSTLTKCEKQCDALLELYNSGFAEQTK
ncbi:MAG: hypothetical protein IJW77_08635 [Clostridia bacterium]|nr:hypothetical protein [Clostridia bacterium]